MGYVESILGGGEEIKYRGNIHWAIFIPGIVLLPIIIGVYFLITAIIAKISTEMAITNKRVILKAGLISRRTIEMNLNKIESVNVDQGIFGRMLNYGSIRIVGTGGTGEPFKWVSSPLDFRRAVQQITQT